MKISETAERLLENPLHIAIDFETLSLSPRGAIVGAAAASFGEADGPCLLFVAWPIACTLVWHDLAQIENYAAPWPSISSDAPQQPGRHVDHNTIAWHKGQPTWSTTQRALEGHGPRLTEAMLQLFKQVRDRAGERPVLWYSRPGAFDGAVMLDLARWSPQIASAEAELGAGVPLHRRVRCLRTLQHDACMIKRVDWSKPVHPHDPTCDALTDAHAAHECVEILRNVGRWGRLVEDELRRLLTACGLEDKIADVGTPDFEDTIRQFAEARAWLRQRQRQRINTGTVD